MLLLRCFYRRRQYPQLSYFNGPWISRIILILVSIPWGFGEIFRLSFLKLIILFIACSEQLHQSSSWLPKLMIKVWMLDLFSSKDRNEEVTFWWLSCVLRLDLRLLTEYDCNASQY
ncbi:hypothetical protein MUK42_36555 [Musa troglodytarum]|uniref:Uncharacterized protein n=1 Tax=Musa troglodytarum TaxID=320322 RepID=A0A9E7JC46_9LILI|nr:hypothetical protein MUK42_36555 [Musa troglodytarum]